MKPFCVIQSGHEVHISGPNKPRPCQQVIVNEYDTYEEARERRDELRIRVAERRAQATDRWHDEWLKADRRGDMERLMQLGHANK